MKMIMSLCLEVTSIQMITSKRNVAASAVSINEFQHNELWLYESSLCGGSSHRSSVLSAGKEPQELHEFKSFNLTR